VLNGCFGTVYLQGWKVRQALAQAASASALRNLPAVARCWRFPQTVANPAVQTDPILGVANGLLAGIPSKSWRATLNGGGQYCFIEE